MESAVFVLAFASDRQRALQAVAAAPVNARVTIAEAKRNDDQNRALWGLLKQIQQQRPEHFGMKMTKEAWKARFMEALGHEVTLLPNLDGTGYFPANLSTSSLSKRDFSDLIEFILAWTAREGLTIQHFDSTPDLKGAVAA